MHYGFKQAVRMMLEVIREFDMTPRQVVITLEGEPQPLIVNREMYSALDGGVMKPIEFAVSIKAARETRFSRISNNQMVLELCSMFQGQIDPAMLMEAMDFDGQELILEKLRASQGQGMQAIQRQAEEMRAAITGLNEQLQELEGEKEMLRSALAAAQKALTAGASLPGIIQMAAPQKQPDAEMPGPYGVPFLQEEQRPMGI